MLGCVVGAVLIGPFEGSRWGGGCGEGLWDLNEGSLLGWRLFLVSAMCRTQEVVRRDVSKGLFGGEGGAAFELFRCEGTRRCVACVSTAWIDRVESGVSHGRSGAIEVGLGRWGRHRGQELMTGDPFDDEHGLRADRARDLCTWSRLLRLYGSVEQEAAT